MVHFSRFRLSGFKSFVDPTELEIGPGLNGIVGPNGCGKSNLVEALRWVMGETSARKIRGDGMEDVIFAGTAQRPPRSAAEVTLILDNSELDAPEPFRTAQDIQVTRRIERDKGSLYKVNGKTVRARDVQMLFADTVSGSNSPALVSQGKITTIINAKPHERRHVLEESAGISGLYTRRHEAELRLRAAESNLTRLDDSMSSMRGQLGALKRQAGQAQKYRDLSETIRGLETLMYWHEWSAAHKRQKELTAQHSAIDTAIATAMGEVALHNTAHEKTLLALPGLRQADMKAHAALQALQIEIDRLAQDRKAAQDALEQAQRDHAQIEQDKEETAESSSETAASLDALVQEEKDLEVALAQLPARIEDHKTRLAAMQAQLDKMDRRYQDLLSAHAARQAEARKARQDTEEYERKARQAEERLSKAQAELDALVAQKNGLGDPEAAKQKRQDAHAALDAIAAKIDAQEQDREISRRTLEESQKFLQEINNDFRLIEGEIKSTSKLLESLRSDEGDTVLAALSVKPGYEKALARALGDLGLKAGMGESDAADVYWDETVLGAAASGSNDLPSLLEFVTVPSLLHHALSRVFVAPSAQAARDAAPALRAGESIVTTDGALWRWDGLRVRPTAKADTSGLSMEHKNRLALLEAERETLAARKVEVEAQVAQAEARYMDVYETLRQTTADRQKAEQAARAANAAWHDLENRLAQMGLRLDHAKEKQQQAAESHAEITAALKKAQAAQSGVSEDDTRKAEAELQKLQDDIAAQRGLLNAQRSDYDVLCFQQKQDNERAERIQSDKAVLQSRIEKLSARAQELSARHADLSARLQALRDNPVHDDTRRETLAQRLGELEAAAKASADALAAAENARLDTSKDLREAEHILATHKEKRASLQSEVAAVMADIERLDGTIRTQLQTAPATLSQKIDEAFGENEVPALEVAKERLIRARHERESMGPVNLRADQEAEEMAAQLETLTRECTDLTEAIDQLRKGIAKLNKEAREKMRAAFEQVNAHFQKLFVRLFNGGTAHLEMIESDDPLEAGLEIFAQPPGKALQSLSLLSGGEQTMTATALIFAMFMTNPSPICVLDEIDAPLDDSNVDRVCDLLEDIARNGRTRFLVVTHHRMTMARMDRLYGVTMSEKGVSKLVSVDLATQQSMLDQLTA